VPKNRDDFPQAHDPHSHEGQNARERGQRDMREKRRAVTGHAKDKRYCHEPRELAASSRRRDNLGQWRAGVDGKGAEEPRHQICRANADKVAIDGGGGARDRDERTCRCRGLHHDDGDDDEGERSRFQHFRECDRRKAETRKCAW
jgi:hypothetical protein